MNKAKQYRLNFVVKNMDDGQYPFISCDKDSTGSTINDDLASFIDCGGVKQTDRFLKEIDSLQPFINNGYLGEYPMDSFNEEVVYLSSPPSVATFNRGGGDNIIPLDDFIEILKEWKAFLQSLPYKHWLSNL